MPNDSPQGVTFAPEDINEDRLRAERLRLWRAERNRMERRPNGKRWRGQARRLLYKTASHTHGLLRPTRPYRWAAKRALELERTEIVLTFPDLPPAFDGYRILHLTDLHLDNIDDTAAAAAALVRDIDSDLCVITGDIRDNVHAPTDLVMERLGRLIEGANAPDGICGILGNHDSAEMLSPMEGLGIRMLVNETMSLKRADDSLHVTGLDDVHRFYTASATAALKAAPDGFCIALVHSPEIADRAAIRHRLYLTGHTHGGQICLPGGRPLATGLRRHHELASGLWRHGEMMGYTSRGVGTCILPFRMHCPGEIAVVTLRKGPSGAKLAGEDARLW